MHGPPPLRWLGTDPKRTSEPVSPVWRLRPAVGFKCSAASSAAYSVYIPPFVINHSHRHLPSSVATRYNTSPFLATPPHLDGTSATRVFTYLRPRSRSTSPPKTSELRTFPRKFDHPPVHHRTYGCESIKLPEAPPDQTPDTDTPRSNHQHSLAPTPKLPTCRTEHHPSVVLSLAPGRWSRTRVASSRSAMLESSV